MTDRDTPSFSAAMERGRLCGRLSLAGVLLSGALAGIVFFADTVFEWSGLKIFSLTLFPFLMAFFAALSALARSALFTKAMREEEEKRLLERRKESVSSLLDVSEDVRFTAKRNLASFEKYFPSALSLFCFLLGGLVLYFLQRAPQAAADAEFLQTAIPGNPVNLAFLSIVCAAFSFFSGIFLAGQSHVREYRYLRPVGGWLIFGALVMFLAAAASLLYVYGKTGYEPWFSKVVLVLEWILCAEFLAGFIIEFYRPRTRGEVSPVYESRILSLFTEPGGVVRNIAFSLDYQFGFSVSKTSVYLFLRKVFVPALMLWLFLLWLFTSVGEVGPGELGIRERFGAAAGEDLKPGMHWKLPWPFERILRIPVDALQSVTVGSKANPDVADASVILWTGTHYRVAEPFLVASKGSKGRSASYSVAILEASLPVYYRAKRSAIRDYAFHFKEIPKALRAVGQAEATAYFASTDFLADISDARERVTSDLRARIQKQCDALEMGIEIVSVCMTDAHPPIGKPGDKGKDAINTNVAEAFQLEVIAREDAKRRRDKALIDVAKAAGNAKVEALKIVSGEETEKHRTVSLAKAEAEQFRIQKKAFTAEPGIFQLRYYLEFLVNDCRDLRKYVVASELLRRIYEFNFEEKTKVDLLENPGLGNLGKEE